MEGGDSGEPGGKAFVSVGPLPGDVASASAEHALEKQPLVIVARVTTKQKDDMHSLEFVRQL